MMPPARDRRARRRSAAFLLALTALPTASLLLCATPARAQQTAATPAKTRVLLADSFREVAAAGKAPDTAHAEIARDLLTASESAEPLQIDLTLRMRNFAELERRVAAGETISREEMAARFLPTEQQYQTVAAWLTGQGLTVGEAGASRSVVVVTGTPAQFQEVFQTRFARVKFRGEEHTAAVTAPSLPTEVQGLVRSVHGLQPYLHPHKHLIHRQTDSISAAGSPPFIPRDMLTAYDAVSTGLTGAGQRIGIIIDYTPALTDLTTFWSSTGVVQSTSNIITINVRNKTLPAPSGEETLDVAWSSALAPSAKVIVYACGDLNYVNLAYSRLLDDLQSNAQPGLHQASMSFGAGEQSDETPDDISAVHQLFTSITALGVSLFAASGDDGPYGNGGEPAQVEYPASDPLVTGVGATTLTLTPSDVISSETGWSISALHPRNDSSSGGGISKAFSRPDYQTGSTVPGGVARLVPDVAFDGDPDTGCYLIFQGKAEQDGGTSWGTPCWAALCALLNQSRAANGLAALNQLNPAIYPLQATSSFHDITSGNNGIYAAGPGYDSMTGLGTPDFAAIVRALGAPPVVHPAFFTGEASLGSGVYYLAFPSGNPFGYYSYLTNANYLFHEDLGYEYVFDAADGHNGVYLYDFTSRTFFYTSPSFPFPYLYDFTLNTVLYYYPDTARAGHYTTNPRYFYDFATGQIISK